MISFSFAVLGSTVARKPGREAMSSHDSIRTSPFSVLSVITPCPCPNSTVGGSKVTLSSREVDPHTVSRFQQWLAPYFRIAFRIAATTLSRSNFVASTASRSASVGLNFSKSS